MLEEKMLYVRKKSAKIYGHRGFSLDNQNLCWAKSISWKLFLFLLLHFSCCSCFSLSASVFLMFVHSTLWIFRPISFEELCRARASKKGSNKNTTSDTYKYIRIHRNCWENLINCNFIQKLKHRTAQQTTTPGNDGKQYLFPITHARPSTSSVRHMEIDNIFMTSCSVGSRGYSSDNSNNNKI